MTEACDIRHITNFSLKHFHFCLGWLSPVLWYIVSLLITWLSHIVQTLLHFYNCELAIRAEDGDGDRGGGVPHLFDGGRDGGWCVVGDASDGGGAKFVVDVADILSVGSFPTELGLALTNLSLSSLTPSSALPSSSSSPPAESLASPITWGYSRMLLLFSCVGRKSRKVMWYVMHTVSWLKVPMQNYANGFNKFLKSPGCSRYLQSSRDILHTSLNGKIMEPDGTQDLWVGGFVYQRIY